MSDSTLLNPPVPPMIFQKLMDLRLAIGGLEARPSKEAYGPKFPVRSSKELVEKLSSAVVDLNLLVYVVHQTVIPMAVDSVDDPKGAAGAKKAGGTCAYVVNTVRVEAEDGSFRDFRGVGSGMDRDDKAGGKASTYAWKDAILKGLSVPYKDMIDTDDEVGQGRDVKPAGKRASGGGSSGGKTGGVAAAEASALAAIRSAGSRAALSDLIPILERLPEDAQLRLNPEYQARKAALPEQTGAS